MIIITCYKRNFTILAVSEAEQSGLNLTSSPDNNNNDTSSNKVILSRSTATYDICPKTGKVYHRQETWLLTDRQRHARFKTEKSLLIKTTTRCMRMKAYKSQTYCCFRKCFKRRPKIRMLNYFTAIFIRPNYS